ncbi:hypothetical protein Tco_1318254 [Tanacetum coccineum]
MMKYDGVKSILKKPNALTNKPGLGLKVTNIEGNLRIPILGANRDTTADTSEMVHVVSKMPHSNEGMTNVLETVGLTSSKNPNSGLDDDGAGNKNTSGNEDNNASMQHEWEDPNIQPIKNASTKVNSPPKQTFPNVVNATSTMSNTPKVNFRAMVNPDKVENSDFVLPIATVQAGIRIHCVSPNVEDITFDVYALPCFGLVLFVMALFIHAL